jgi:hypothetical protein
MQNSDKDQQGIISPVSKGDLKSSPGRIGLTRTAMSIREVKNPPAALFKNGFTYAWTRVGETDNYEMDLGLWANEDLNIRSLGELAFDLQTNPPDDPTHSRYREFDFAISYLLTWIQRMLKNDCRELGLITPENALVLRAPAWAGSAPSDDARTSDQEIVPRDLRVVLADLGFRRKTGGTLPSWLESTGRYSFLWDDTPEQACSRQFDATWGIPFLARFIAFLLEPGCGVQKEHRSIDLESLNRLPAKAKIWQTLAKAIDGYYAARPDGLAEFMADVRREHPSLHFIHRRDGYRFGAAQPVPAIAASLVERRTRRNWKWIAVPVVLLSAAFVAVMFWLLPTAACDCCPEVRPNSPLFADLKVVDGLRGREANRASPPDRLEGGMSLELTAITKAHETLENLLEADPSRQLAAEVDCLQHLRERYLAQLHQEWLADYEGLRSGGAGQPQRLESLSWIREELGQLEKLEPGRKPADWESVFIRCYRNYRKQIEALGHDHANESG